MFDYKKYFLYDDDEPAAALPTPVTTKEQYLYAKVTGGDTSNLPTPVTTEEQYLYAMAQSGGDSGDGGASAVTLYPADSGDNTMLYKDEARTQGFATYDEAVAFVQNNPLIRIKFGGVGGDGWYLIPVMYGWGYNSTTGTNAVSARTFDATYFLFIEPDDDGGDDEEMIK